MHFWGPFYYQLTWISAWISNHIHSKNWDEITYPFSNFNDTIEVWERISHVTLHIMMDVMIYPCRD